MIDFYVSCEDVHCLHMALSRRKRTGCSRRLLAPKQNRASLCQTMDRFVVFEFGFLGAVVFLLIGVVGIAATSLAPWLQARGEH